MEKGERYLCCFDIGCGECFYCQRQLYSCCMRSNPSNMTCGLYGHKLGGLYGRPLRAQHPVAHLPSSTLSLWTLSNVAFCMSALC